MSGLKPVIRQVKDSVLHGMGHGRDKLHQLADNLDGHLDTLVAQVRTIDVYDAVTTTRGRNRNVTVFDRDTRRPIHQEGTILDDFGGTPRGDNATEIGRLGNPGDHGGHLGAHRFFGDTPDQGIVPQAGNLNLSAWRTMENEWASWAAHGARVDYSISIDPPGAVRPDNFEVSYVISDPSTGEIMDDRNLTFQNVAGQSFDRGPR